jgi:hypothetical protein
MGMKGLLPKLVLGVALLFGLIQLVPAQRTNPPATQTIVWDSDQTRALANRACMDCHSNETRWPWYAYVAPASWLTVRNVNEARRELNFSEWDQVRAGRKQKLGAEMEEQIVEARMPDPMYVPLHPESNLTEIEKQQLIAGLKASVAK